MLFSSFGRCRYAAKDRREYLTWAVNVPAPWFQPLRTLLDSPILGS
jgi:hypothetical protein